MTLSAWCDARRLDQARAGLVGALVMGQMIILALLWQLSLADSLLFVAGAGLPIAMACYRLLARPASRSRVQSALVMFAAGGFGMLLGFIVDFGPLGLYGLLGLCRSWESSAWWPSPAELWRMTTLMPWACIGMLAGGNAGMALFRAPERRRTRPIAFRIGVCAFCSAGMLLGMAVAEHVATRVALGLEQDVAGALTMVAMLAGMAAGMSAPLSLAARIPRIGRAFAGSS